MFISHWFEFSGIDKVIAPIITSADANDNAKGSPSSANSNENGNDADYVSLNYQEENPLWGILAPRQEPSVKNNNQEYDDNKAIGEGRVEAFTKAPPAEVFRRQRQQQQPIAELADSSAAVNCVHCHKMTPINSNEENNAQLQQLQQQLLQQKEHLQALYENALRELSSVTKAKCELEEEIKKKEEIEEMKMKRDYDVDHYGHGRCVPNDDNRQQTPTTSMSINYDGGAKTVTAMITPAAKAIAAVPPTDERLIDEHTYKTKSLSLQSKQLVHSPHPHLFGRSDKNSLNDALRYPKRRRHNIIRRRMPQVSSKTMVMVMISKKDYQSAVLISKRLSRNSTEIQI
jgi:cytochrome c553